MAVPAGPKRPSDPKDEFLFHDHHLPTLKNDTYTVAARQVLIASGSGPGAEKVEGNAALTFRVAGPQLSLPAGTVIATFPANLAQGKFHTVLPHVTLSRSTLPWERNPSDSAGNAPWLVLLVLDAATYGTVSQETIKAGKLPRGAGIARNDAAPDDVVTLASLPSALVRNLLPEFDDLNWLAHVRSVQPVKQPNERKTPPVEAETATVLAATLPTPGVQNHALLISVEGRYRGDSKPTGAAEFPVLHQWSFFCEKAHEHGFKELLGRAADHSGVPAPFSLPVPASAPVGADVRYEAGMVPVAHHMRRGDASAAWYHGPLLPSAPNRVGRKLRDRLPADHADALLSLDDGFAMLDISYSAAWELGRLLALQNAEMARDIYHWKRAHAQAAHLRNAPPIGQARPPLPPMPKPIADWLQRDLIELRALPFEYLVPDKDLLPPDSFRFFDVDPFWLDCLRDGALAVGRTDSAQRLREKDMRKALADPPAMSGVLLRSAAVSDFPHLEVDGYDQPPPASNVFTTRPRPILRMERLSPNVLLVLFEGTVRTVDLHLHPQAVHFGFEEVTASQPHYMRKVPKHTANPVPQKLYFDTGTKTAEITAARRVRIDTFAKALISGLTTPSGPVSKFALQMLEGVPLVRFQRKT